MSRCLVFCEVCCCVFWSMILLWSAEILGVQIMRWNASGDSIVCELFLLLYFFCLRDTYVRVCYIFSTVIGSWTMCDVLATHTQLSRYPWLDFVVLRSRLQSLIISLWMYHWRPTSLTTRVLCCVCECCELFYSLHWSIYNCVLFAFVRTESLCSYFCR